jgi:hypothetical protein
MSSGQRDSRGENLTSTAQRREPEAAGGSATTGPGANSAPRGRNGEVDPATGGFPSLPIGQPICLTAGVRGDGFANLNMGELDQTHDA